MSMTDTMYGKFPVRKLLLQLCSIPQKDLATEHNGVDSAVITEITETS